MNTQAALEEEYALIAEKVSELKEQVNKFVEIAEDLISEDAYVELNSLLHSYNDSLKKGIGLAGEDKIGSLHN